MPLSYSVEPAQAHDMAHVYESWVGHYRTSPRAAEWPTEVYTVYQRHVIDRLLKRARLIIARPDDWPEGIYGWLCAEQTPRRFVIHFGVTKPQYRNMGVFWRLVESLRPEGKAERDTQALVFSHLRPPYVDTLRRHGFVFDKHAAR